MASILIYMSPEAGHLVPSIKIASDLMQRGHRITYLTCGKIREELGALGFETCILFSPEWPELEGRSIFGICNSAPSMWNQLVKRFRSPLRLIYSIRAEIRNAACFVNADLVLVDGPHDLEWGGEMCRDLDAEYRIARICQQLPYWMPVAKKQDARPTLYLSPSQFELPGQLDLSAHYTEPAIYLGGNADRGEIDWQTVDPNAPLVYCTLGNQVDSYPDVMRLYQQILVAAESAPEYHFIISAGTLSEKLMPWLKPNTSIYSYVHSAQVLAKASAAIIHGGFGTIKECIWFRVPMLVYPQMWDQPLNARRVEFHGLGVNAGRSPLSSDGILEAVRSLLRDTQVKDRLYEMQSVFQKSEAGQRSAQVCEELLSGRTAVAIGSDRAIA